MRPAADISRNCSLVRPRAFSRRTRAARLSRRTEQKRIFRMKANDQRGDRVNGCPLTSREVPISRLDRLAAILAAGVVRLLSAHGGNASADQKEVDETSSGRAVSSR